MSPFQEIKQFDDLYARLKSIGCVIQFAPLRFSGEAQKPVELHRQAALAGLAILKQRVDAYFENLLRLPQYAGKQRADFFSLSIKAELLGNGEAVQVSELLGPYCDYPRRRLLIKGEPEAGRRHYYWFGDREVPDKRQPEPDVGRKAAGLARAYLDPPYQLRGPKSEWNALFFDVLAQLCGGLEQPVEIYAWSPDCSNFFDAGKEWWGCYFWTLHPIHSDRYVMIAASSTD